MKALKKIDNFSGVEDVERWIGKFELAIDIDGKKDKEAQILCMFLNDSAYDVYNNLSDEDKQDAAAIKGALRNAFGLRRIDAWKAALSKRVCIGESLDVAGDEIKKFFKIVCEGGDASDYVPGVLLLDSLPVNIREQVVLQIGNDVTYSNVLSAAKKIWPGKVESGACIGGLNAQIGYHQRNIPSPRKIDPRRIEDASNSAEFPRRSTLPRCSGCKRVGHVRRDCKTLCYKCHQIGHVIRDCTSAVSLNGSEGATSTESVVPQSAQNLEPRPSRMERF